MKKQSNLSRLLQIAGNHKYLTYASWVLSAISALIALVPFYYIWKVMQEVLAVAPDFSHAQNLTRNGWMAVLFAVIAVLVYIGALMCSHKGAFRIATNLRLQTMEHIVKLPLGFAEQFGSGRLRKIVNESSAATETYLAHQLPDRANAIATPCGLLVLLLVFDWRLGLLSLVPVVLGFLIMMTMTGKKMQEKMKEIQRKYKNNPEKLNQETMDLYKREKLNPFSGCLSSILQIIIILSVFWLVSKPLTYMKKVDTNIINGYVEEIKNEEGKASAYPEIQVIQKKASTDENVNINMEFFGLDLSKVPNQNMGDITVYIIPVLYIITSFISIKITNGKKKKNKTLQIEEKTSKDKVNVEDGKTENDESLEAMQEMNNSMMYMVPIMSISIAFIAPLGLALYWLVSNILIIIERLIIDKIFNKEEDKNA